MSEPTSPRFSLAGWSWRTYFAKTKAGLKWIVACLVAYLTIVLATVEPPELKGLLVAVLGYGSKLLLDILDFWFSDVPLETKEPGSGG